MIKFRFILGCPLKNTLTKVQQSGQNHHIKIKPNNRNRTSKDISRMVPSNYTHTRRAHTHTHTHTQMFENMNYVYIVPSFMPVSVVLLHDGTHSGEKEQRPHRGGKGGGAREGRKN